MSNKGIRPVRGTGIKRAYANYMYNKAVMPELGSMQTGLTSLRHKGINNYKGSIIPTVGLPALKKTVSSKGANYGKNGQDVRTDRRQHFPGVDTLAHRPRFPEIVRRAALQMGDSDVSKCLDYPLGGSCCKLRSRTWNGSVQGTDLGQSRGEKTVSRNPYIPYIVGNPYVRLCKDVHEPYPPLLKRVSFPKK